MIITVIRQEKIQEREETEEKKEDLQYVRIYESMNNARRIFQHESDNKATNSIIVTTGIQVWKKCMCDKVCPESIGDRFTKLQIGN